ncbi:MAG: TIGR01777 family oxidoreductase [Planctomycetota bacterium]|jgi:uncharacterized protein (TIGR01777 family)
MKIVVTGATGFIGRALCNELAKEHNIIALTRRPEKASVLFERPVDIIKWNPKDTDGWEKSLDGSDAIVNLAGTNLASGRWYKNFKAEILESRIQASKILIQAIENSKVKPKAVITASAIGFYGNRADEKLNEESRGGFGFLAGLAQKIEDCSREFETLGLRSVVIRTGIVLGSSGGALPKMIMPFKLHLGGYWGSGDQWMSWVSLADEVAAIKFLIENSNLYGAFNLTSPEPVQNRQFFQILAKVLRRPCCLPIPAFVLKIMFGQMADELFLASQRVYPGKLIDAGFEFKYSELKKALESIKFEGKNYESIRLF